MVSDKAREIRTEIDAQENRQADAAQSHAMIAELVENCQPTVDEFDEMTYHVILSGGDLYRVIELLIRLHGHTHGPFDYL